MAANGTMTVGEMLSQLRNTPIAVPGATNGDGAAHRDAVSGDDALAVWAKNYANSEEGKRVSALIDVRLRALHVLIAEQSFSDEVLDAFAKGVGDAIDRALAPLVARNAELEQRIAELEKKKGIAPLARRLAELEDAALTDGDIWNDHSKYRKGCVVTHGGNLWLCKQENSSSRPPSDSWRLMNRTKAHQ